MKINGKFLAINILAVLAVMFFNIQPGSCAAKNTQEQNKVTVKSSEVREDDLSQDYSNNYVDEVYQKYKQIVKWNKNYVLVYLPRDEREEFVWSQFKKWERALKGTIIFEQILTENGADIAVHYANQFLGKKAGYTKLAFKDGSVTHADLYIYDDILENPLRNYCVLHEIGHALGITAHSSNPSDIMYITMTGRQSGLSVRDVNTLLTIYTPENNSKISPVQIGKGKTQLDAKVQKANTMADNAQFEPAIKLYEQAIKDGDNVAESYYGLARCYYGLDKKNKSYDYAKKAIGEDPDNKTYLYGYIKIALDTKHHSQLKKFLNKYMLEKDDALLDRNIQSALIYLDREETANRK